MLEIEDGRTKMIIDGELDKDGEVEVEVEYYDDSVGIYLDKEKAAKVVAHLKKLFKLI